MPCDNYDTLLTEQRGAALWVTLNRPESLNTLTSTMIDELLRLFTALERDREVRVVVLRGAGRAFCAGLDLKDLLPRLESMAAPEVLDLQRRLSRVILAMRRADAAGPVLVVSGINLVPFPPTSRIAFDISLIN